MIDEVATGATDWRSETEKRKSMLRKAMASTFKVWIPDHPEASMERGECFRAFREAMSGFAQRLTLVSMLSNGLEDLTAHEYVDGQLSLQDLLVQREGTDAFLDPRNALKVVRRKFGMMTLISRMASNFEQRNVVAITLMEGFTESEYLEFAKVMSRRVEGTAAEEEDRLKKTLRRANFEHIDVLFHPEYIGRRLPVPWLVRHLYSLLGRDLRKHDVDPKAATQRRAEEWLPKLNLKALRQFALYTPDLAVDLDAPDAFNPAEILLQNADESALLSVTRSIFDEFQELRAARSHQAALGLLGHTLTSEEIEKAADEGFIVDENDDELLRLGQTLERIRNIRGRLFFGRISMVSGDINFLDAARGGGELHSQLNGEADPLESLEQARSVTEPFYRARALAAATPLLIKGGFEEQARAAAAEALTAARLCKGADIDQAYTAALSSLIAVSAEDDAIAALGEVLRYGHKLREPDQRAASVMRVVSTLMQVGALPPKLKSALPKAILGEDIHFWGRKEISPPLVEAILSLLPEDSDDTLIFLQKISSHPEAGVRKSVMRAMPFNDSEALKSILLSHLKDRDTEVRIEVIERIGWRGERTLALYLLNHLRHGEAGTPSEKRSIALNLARLDPDRYVGAFNAMLGSIGVDDRIFTDRFKPFRDDEDLQMASLEVLLYLGSRDARKILYSTTQTSRGAMREFCERVWKVVKARPYGDAVLPRSPHDPEYNEDNATDLISVLQRLDPPRLEEDLPSAAPLDVEPPPEDAGPGLFERLKIKFFGKKPPKRSLRGPRVSNEASSSEGDDTSPDELSNEELPPVRPIQALLRFDGVLLDGPDIWTGTTALRFALYLTEDAQEMVWSESHSNVRVEDGRFEVLLGLNNRLPTKLPNIVWLGMSISDGVELTPRTRLSRARTIVQC